MNISETDLNNLKQLSYLDDSDTHSHLYKDINAIINFMAQLRQINTDDVSPLFHPLDLQQRFRKDEISEKDCQAQLEQIATVFAKGFYLVPKVIDLG